MPERYRAKEGAIIKQKTEKIKGEKNLSGRLDEPMLLLVLTLLAIGLIMLFSASYAMAYSKSGEGTSYIISQGIYAAVGVVAMLIISKIDYHILKRFMPIIVSVTFLLMAAVPFVGKLVKGARRWIEIGPIGFQPSEIAKFALILFFAVQMTKMGTKKMKTFRYGFVYYMFCLGVLAGLLVLQKHLSAIVIVGVTGAMMMFVGGTRIGYMVVLALTGVAGGIGYVAINPYAMARVQVWLDPFIDFKGKGWQGAQSLMAVGSGGFWGMGLGQSRQKHLFLPEPANDFIFSVVCEELGFIGAMLVLLVFAAFIIRGYYIAMRASDKFGSLLAVGITTQIGFQAIFNICVVTGLVPVTGVSLPFFSAGGTSLLMLLGEVGVLLSISRSIPVPKEE